MWVAWRIIADASWRGWGAVVYTAVGVTIVSYSLWYPLMRGCLVVTVPSPLDTKKIIEAIQQEKATVMIGAPTFIRPFLKKATKEELRTLNLVVTGAEKLPMDLYEAFLAQFGIEILQGYGLTETTPVDIVRTLSKPDDAPTSSARSEPYPEFKTRDIACDEVSPLLYALDTMLTVFQLHMESKCEFTDNTRSGRIGRLVKGVFSLLGWIIVTLAALTWTGVLRREPA